MSLRVVKVGGAALADAAWLADEQGVPVSRIGRFDALLDATAGTRVGNEAEVGAWL